MNSRELREKLQKSEDNVEKIKKTIARHFAQADKKKAIILENGWTFDRWQYVGGGPTPNEDAYWTICDYEGKISDAESAKKKLVEAERIRDNWKSKLDRQLELEATIQTEIPEIFKKVRDELIETWTEWDILEREKMYKLEKEYRDKYPEYRDFRDAWYKLYSYSKQESLKKTDEEFRKMEEREADIWLLDLYNRVYAITGKVTDCSGIRWGGKCLDGVVVGEAGKANVETIEAGGYNDSVLLDSGRHGQRWHLRTLVKELN